MTINPDTRIDLETDCYIRGGVYFKADGATGTVDVNTSSPQHLLVGCQYYIL